MRPPARPDPWTWSPSGLGKVQLVGHAGRGARGPGAARRRPRPGSRAGSPEDSRYQTVPSAAPPPAGWSRPWSSRSGRRCAGPAVQLVAAHVGGPAAGPRRRATSRPRRPRPAAPARGRPARRWPGPRWPGAAFGAVGQHGHAPVAGQRREPGRGHEQLEALAVPQVGHRAMPSRSKARKAGWRLSPCSAWVDDQQAAVAAEAGHVDHLVVAVQLLAAPADLTDRTEKPSSGSPTATRPLGPRASSALQAGSASATSGAAPRPRTAARASGRPRRPWSPRTRPPWRHRGQAAGGHAGRVVRHLAVAVGARSQAWTCQTRQAEATRCSGASGAHLGRVSEGARSAASSEARSRKCILRMRPGRGAS